jgi:ATPase subunit of ABC transporter with duplicated ATPase domains
LTQINQSGKICRWSRINNDVASKLKSLSRFNFGGGEQNKKVSALSGGERNRFIMTLKKRKVMYCYWMNQQMI